MKPLKIGVYIRVSTEDQVNVFEGSLDSQKHRIDEFVQYKNRQEKNWGGIVEYYVEEGVSAGTANRPVYQKLMADVRKGKVNLILVSDLTRLSRNLLDFCNLIKELEEHKASYLSMKEQFDTSTPIGRMMVFIIICLGQFEREQTSERVSVNCHSRALRGLINGGPAPLGYDRHPEKPGLLIVNEAEVKVVKTIFDTFLKFGSRAKTIEELHAIGIMPKRTSKRALSRAPVAWTVQSLGSLLQKTAYIGHREVNKVYKDEDSNYLKPWQKYQMVKASWPAIIDEQIFYDVQKLLEEASEKERTRRGKSETRIFLLTGILTCGELGLPLVGQAGHGNSGNTYRYYHYVRKPKGEVMVRPRLNADELEEKLLNEFKTALKTARYFTNLQNLLKDQAEAKNKGHEAEFERAQKELNQTKDRIRTIWENQSRMHLGEEALRLASDELNRLAKQQQDLEKYLSELNVQTNDRQVFRDQALFVENNIRASLQGWAKATPAMRKRLLRRTVKEIIVTRSEMKITFWLSAGEQLDATGGGSSFGADGSDNIIRFPGHLPQDSNHNLSTESSGKKRIGSERRT